MHLGSPHEEVFFTFVGSISYLTHLQLDVLQMIPDHALESIAQLTQLRTLTLRWSSTGSEAWKTNTSAVGMLLPRLKSLLHLNLSGSGIADSAADALMKSIAQLQQLTGLDLGNCWIRGVGNRALAHVLPQLPHIKCLDVSQSLQRLYWCDDLRSYFAACTYLEELHINGVTDGACILPCISGLEFLIHLQMERVEWADYLTDHLWLMSSLKVLKISCHQHTLADNEYLEDFSPPAGVLEKCIGHLTMLQELHLGYSICEYSVERMTELAPHMKNLCSLTALHIQGSYMLDDDGAALTELVNTCKCLAVLRVREKDYERSTTLDDLFTCLLTKSTLRDLSFSTRRSTPAAYEIEDNTDLRSLADLQTLHLQINEPDRQGLRSVYFGSVLKLLPKLRHLYLSDQFHQGDAWCLDTANGAMTGLLTLSFAGCRFSCRAWDEIVLQFPNLLQLETLHLPLGSELHETKAISLGRHLGELAALTKLYLPHGWASEHIGEAIAQLTGLRELAVWRDEFVDVGLSGLAPYISSLCSMKIVDM